jgi:hypothetical protein
MSIDKKSRYIVWKDIAETSNLARPRSYSKAFREMFGEEGMEISMDSICCWLNSPYSSFMHLMNLLSSVDDRKNYRKYLDEYPMFASDNVKKQYIARGFINIWRKESLVDRIVKQCH